MQILLANAKIMFNSSKIKPQTVPLWQNVAEILATEMAQCDINMLSQQLNCSYNIANENIKRYQNFFIAEKMPAIMAYNGQAYKHLCATSLNKNCLNFAQKHLWISCFLYGLLRPMDGIVPYRMEQNVKLEATNNLPINKFWKDKLTDTLINSITNDDGILIHLSTSEYEQLFDWKRVKKETNIIQPLFYVRNAKGFLKMQAVWAKSCRGAMVKYIIENKITSPNHLKAFEYEGFKYNPNLGETAFPHFVREDF